MPTLKLTCTECAQVNRVPSERLTGGPKCGTCGAALLPDRPAEVDAAWLVKAARTDDLPLVVDFWAPWCGPCRMMAPQFAQAAAALKGQARLVKLNTEDDPQAGARHNIRGIPTIVKFVKGRETARQSGALRAEQIVGWVRG